jgi:hypothetical protein
MDILRDILPAHTVSKTGKPERFPKGILRITGTPVAGESADML